MIKHYQTTLYHQQQKTKPVGYTASQPIHATESGQSLFQVATRAHFIADLKKSVKTPTEHFEALYVTLLYNVAEFVQQLPTLEDASVQWLDAVLERSQKALQLLEERLQDSPAGHKTNSTYKAQLTYAVWSAALLQHIDVMVTHWAAHICTEQGEFVKEWQPLLESLWAAGSYYQPKLQGPHTEETKLHPITLLLAKNLMPADGLLWLASQPQLFQEWLSALLGEEGRGSIIESILTMITVLRPPPKEHFSFHPAPFFPVAPQPSSPPPVVVPQPPAPAAPIIEEGIADRFIEWLKLGLLDGSIIYNTPDAWVHLTRIGLYINPLLFQYFCRVQPHSVPWRQVYHAVCARLGILTPNDPTMASFFINGKRQAPGAIIEKNIGSFFPNNVVPPLSPAVTMESPNAAVYPTLLHSDIHKKRAINKKSEGG